MLRQSLYSFTSSIRAVLPTSTCCSSSSSSLLPSSLSPSSTLTNTFARFLHNDRQKKLGGKRPNLKPPQEANPKEAKAVYHDKAKGKTFVTIHPSTPFFKRIVEVGKLKPHEVEPPKPRRFFKPKPVQYIPTPSRVTIAGPRALGHKILRTFIGKVVSDRNDKTIAVEVTQYYKHPKYPKLIKTSKKFQAHDEHEECDIGDVVEIRVSRPYSKTKHFTLHKILRKRLSLDKGSELYLQTLEQAELIQKARTSRVQYSGEKKAEATPTSA